MNDQDMAILSVITVAAFIVLMLLIQDTKHEQQMHNVQQSHNTTITLTTKGK